MLQNGAVLLIFPVLICRRIGLAYELTPKTVLRGGFAIYSITFYIDGVNQSGFCQSALLVPAFDAGLTFNADRRTLFPDACLTRRGPLWARPLSSVRPPASCPPSAGTRLLAGTQ